MRTAISTRNPSKLFKPILAQRKKTLELHQLLIPINSSIILVQINRYRWVVFNSEQKIKLKCHTKHLCGLTLIVHYKYQLLRVFRFLFLSFFFVKISVLYRILCVYTFILALSLKWKKIVDFVIAILDFYSMFNFIIVLLFLFVDVVYAYCLITIKLLFGLYTCIKFQ